MTAVLIMAVAVITKMPEDMKQFPIAAAEIVAVEIAVAAEVIEIS